MPCARHSLVASKNVALAPLMPWIEGVLDAQIDAPHVPSSLQHRTAAVPIVSSVHSIVSGVEHASTVSANGWSGCTGGGGGDGGGGTGGGGDGGGGRGGGGAGGGDGGGVHELRVHT